MTDSATPPEQTQTEPLPESLPAVLSRADDLLAGKEAAALMGKTPHQFTAYASHHRLPREDGKFRRSVIEAEIEKTRLPGRPRTGVAPNGQRAEQMSATSAGAAEKTPDVALIVAYAQQQITDLTTRFTALAEQIAQSSARESALHGEITELHERLHGEQDARIAADREAHEREQRLRAEFDAREADLRAIAERERQRADAERAKREDTEAAEREWKCLSLLQRWFGKRSKPLQ